MSDAQVRDWEALNASFTAIRSPRGSARSDSDLIDHTGALAAWFKRHHARVIAVRPDRFVAAADPTGLEPPTPPGSATTTIVPPAHQQAVITTPAG